VYDFARLTQLAEVTALSPVQWGFESPDEHPRVVKQEDTAFELILGSVRRQPRGV
jgi:hypothetical protein